MPTFILVSIVLIIVTIVGMVACHRHAKKLEAEKAARRDKGEQAGSSSGVEIVHVYKIR